MSVNESLFEANLTQPSFNPDYGINVKELVRCYSTVIPRPPPNESLLYCKAVFDHWLCWDYALAGTVVEQKCPSDFKPFKENAFARKVCMPDGNWFVHPESNVTWTDYGACPLDTVGQETTMYVTIAGYTISIIFLIISLTIFNTFRQLRCARVILHQHLFVSFILTGVMWIASNTQFLVWPHIGNENPTWCKVLCVLTQYASVCNYFWMLCEGLFLHTIIVQAFAKQKKLLIICCLIGWGLPFVPITAYSLARAIDAQSNTMCWFQPDWTIWFLSIPIVVSLVIDFVLLLNILRILLSKMRSYNSPEHNQYRRAVKAILILIPLLGLQNLLTLVKPSFGPDGTLVWNMASAVLISFQGAAVALIFCFFNGEVLTVLRRRWGQWRHNHDPFLSRPTNSTTMAMTLDESTAMPSPQGPIYKNGLKKDAMELQPMMPANKGVTFKH